MNKTLKTVSIVLSLIFLGLRIFSIVDDAKRIDTNLAQGLLGISLAAAFHFSMEEQRLSKPEEYKPKTHKLVVILWGVVGLISLASYFYKMV